MLAIIASIVYALWSTRLWQVVEQHHPYPVPLIAIHYGNGTFTLKRALLTMGDKLGVLRFQVFPYGPWVIRQEREP
jgi:hypothetical protein